MKAKIKNTATAVALCLAASTGAAQAATIGDTSVKFTGYIKVAMVSDYSDGTIASGSVGRDFYIPSLTPVGGVDEDPQFDAISERHDSALLLQHQPLKAIPLTVFSSSTF